MKQASKTRGFTTLLLTGFVAMGHWTGGPAHPQTVDDDWLIERLAASTPLAEHRAVEIRNAYGDLRVRAAGDGLVVATAIMQRHRDDGDRPLIAVESVAGNLLLEVRYPPGKPPAEPAMRNRRVDMTVFIPQGPPVSLRTVAGLLNVRLDSDLALATVSGPIDVKTKGRLQATTERGKIVAVLQASTWSGAHSVKSKTGDIEIWLARDANAAIDAETSGWLTTDFSVEIRHDDTAGRKQIRARLGDGKSHLQVHSVNGAIRLFRSP